MKIFHELLSKWKFNYVRATKSSLADGSTLETWTTNQNERTWLSQKILSHL